MANKIYLVVFCYMLAFFIGGCANHPSNDTNERVTIEVLVLPYLSYAPLYIGIEEGYFQEEGLDLHLQRYIKSNDAIAAFIQNDLQVFSGAISPAIFNAIAEGARIQIVAGKGSHQKGECYYSKVLQHRDFDLATAVEPCAVYLGRLGTIQRFMSETIFTDKLLERCKLTSLNGPMSYTALRNGELDMVLLGEPWATRSAQLPDVEETIIIADHFPDFDFSFMYFNHDLLYERPEIGKSFLRAYEKSLSRYREGKTGKNIASIARHVELDSATLLQACWLPIKGSREDINYSTIKAYQEWLLKQDLITSIIPESQLISSPLTD